MSDYRKRDPEKERIRKREQKSESRKRNPIKSMDSRLRKEFGITHVEYQTIWERQQGKCAVCGDCLMLRDKHTHLDHDHETGVVRGILCIHCNGGLGSLKDSPQILLSAMRYLQKHEQD
jgi:hypothetical protein